MNKKYKKFNPWTKSKQIIQQNNDVTNVLLPKITIVSELSK